MSLVLDGNLGASMIQDGVVTEGKIVTGAVTDNKLTLTANSQEIKDALNASGSAPIYACRAWVNFNGTGTVAIRASGNVSSITDNGTGDYTVNFTTAMPDANYDMAGNTSGATNSGGTLQILASSSGADATLKSTTQMRVICANQTGTFDSAQISISVFR